MSLQEATWVMAHEARLNLKRYGLTEAELERVRTLRSRMGVSGEQAPEVVIAPRMRVRPTTDQTVDGQPTPAVLFDSRFFHAAVQKSSRKLFVGGHLTEAVRRTSQGLVNRVKKLSGLSVDGQALMSKAFSTEKPYLQMSCLKTESEKDEHEGARFLMMGAVAAFRNPCSHEDRWPPVEDAALALEALSLVSLLHRLLDRCESYRAENP